MKAHATVGAALLILCLNAQQADLVVPSFNARYEHGSNAAPAVAVSSLSFGPFDIAALRRCEKPVQTFAVLSDFHFSTQSDQASCFWAREKTESAVSKLKARGISSYYIFGCGDLNFSSFNSSMMRTMKAIWGSFSYCYATGNHDCSVDGATYESVLGQWPTTKLSSSAGLFTALTMSRNAQYMSDSPYDQTDLDKVFQFFSANRGTRFLFMHFPLPMRGGPAGAGLRPGQFYGFTESSTQDAAILNRLKEIGNVIVFSGHTHYTFEVQDTYPNIIVSQVPGSTVWLVHVPSVSQPKDANFSRIAGRDAPVQGLVVTVYPKYTELQGVNLSPVTAVDQTCGDDLPYRWTIPIGRDI